MGCQVVAVRVGEGARVEERSSFPSLLWTPHSTTSPNPTPQYTPNLYTTSITTLPAAPVLTPFPLPLIYPYPSTLCPLTLFMTKIYSPVPLCTQHHSIYTHPNLYHSLLLSPTYPNPLTNPPYPSPSLAHNPYTPNLLLSTHKETLPYELLTYNLSLFPTYPSYLTSTPYQCTAAIPILHSTFITLPQYISYFTSTPYQCTAAIPILHSTFITLPQYSHPNHLKPSLSYPYTSLSPLTPQILHILHTTSLLPILSHNTSSLTF